MTIRRNLTAIPKDIREWTRFFSQLLFAREFTLRLEGCTTEPEATCRYTMSAGIVVLQVPELTGESNTTLCFFQGLPQDITPAHDQLVPFVVVENGVTQWGRLFIGTDFVPAVYADLDQGAFTASGTKGWRAQTVVYALD